MYMGFAVWRVFYNVYLEDIGLRGSEIGTLNAIMQATIFFVVILWGIIADKKGIRPTLRIAVIATAIFIFFLGYFQSFWLLLIYIPVLTLFHHPLGPLADALAVQFSEKNNKYSYGSFRLWGSLGWALASIIGGILFERIKISNIFLVSALLFLILIVFLTTKKRKKIYRPDFKPIKFSDLLKDRSLFIFFIIIILYGITCAPVNSFLNLYFTELSRRNDLVGYAYAIMAFSELPLFIVGSILIRKLGAQKVILIAMFTMFLRYILYGLLPDISLALAVGLLQGISLPFFLVGAIDYLHKVMPLGQYAKIQSFMWGGYFGLGQMTGNLIIGYLIDQSGMIQVMKIFIVISIICFLSTYLYFRIKKAT
jgi:PPP family 3-phenylpropionic acid transporter